MLSGISGVLIYLDDILVSGHERSEHDARLNTVLTRLHEWSFRLCLKKCKFHSTSVRYLGFLISANSIQPDPARIQPIRSMRISENTKELCSFLDLVNYYGKFVQNLHRLKAPFKALLKLYWRKMFFLPGIKNCRRLLTTSSAPFLDHFSWLTTIVPILPKLTLIVAADASSTGIGGVLLQRSPNDLTKAVFHMSKTLTKAQ